MKKLTLILCVSSCLMAGNAMADHHVSIWPNISADFSVINDNNINKTQWDRQISKDKFLDTRITGAYFQELNQFHELSYTGTLSIEEYDNFKGLEKTAFKLGVGWDFQFGSSFATPAYHLGLNIETADYETDIRDNTNYTFTSSMAIRITDVVTSTLGLVYKTSEAETLVFDTEEARFFANFDLILNHTATLYGTYSYIDGDIVSTARASYNILNFSEVIEPDNAFGGVAAGALAYRLDAKTQVLNVGLNYSIDESNAIDASAMKIQSDADGGINYDRVMLRVGYLVRF